MYVRRYMSVLTWHTLGTYVLHFNFMDAQINHTTRQTRHQQILLIRHHQLLLPLHQQVFLLQGTLRLQRSFNPTRIRYDQHWQISERSWHATSNQVISSFFARVIKTPSTAKDTISDLKYHGSKNLLGPWPVPCNTQIRFASDNLGQHQTEGWRDSSRLLQTLQPEIFQRQRSDRRNMEVCLGCRSQAMNWLIEASTGQ